MEKSNEEKAREIALWLYGPDEGMSEGLVRTLIDKITEALASAEKKGREETKRLNMSDAVRFKNEGWNEAIEEARKVAEEHKSTDGECPESIANAEGYRTAVSHITESIGRLKK